MQNFGKAFSQPEITCLTSTIETLEQGVEYIQSLHLVLVFFFVNPAGKCRLGYVNLAWLQNVLGATLP